MHRSRVVVGLAEEPDVLVQDFSGRHCTWAVLAPLMLKLVRYDDAWQPWPELAEEVPAPSRGTWTTSGDGTTEVEYRVRPGLRWHDGRLLTASDVVASFRLLRELDGEFPHKEIIDRIADIVVSDACQRSFVVRWRPGQLAARFEEWGTVLPVHCIHAINNRRSPARLAESLSARPVFHGPYRFVDWRKGHYLRLTRYQPHPRGNPTVDDIEFRFYRSPAELKTAVLAGEVDLTELSGFTGDDVAGLQARAPEFEVSQVESSTWEHLDFNLEDCHLSDRRVRHAIAHAIDRGGIAAIHGTACRIAHSWLPRRHPAHNPHTTRYPYDPGRAARLLAEAGYRRAVDGVLRDPSGDPVTMRLLTTGPGGARWAASAKRVEAARLVAEHLAATGIHVLIDAPAPEEAFRRIRSREFAQLAMFAWSIGLETNGYLMWHSSQIPKQLGDYGINVSAWRSATNDHLLDRIVAEGETQTRLALIADQQAEWARELPSLPLLFLPHINAYRRGLRNVRYVGAFGAYVTWNSWEWKWEWGGRR